MRALNTTSLKCCLHSTDVWQMGKKSRIRTRVKGRLMQARFFEIHQVFAEKKVGYFSNRPRMGKKYFPLSGKLSSTSGCSLREHKSLSLQVTSCSYTENQAASSLIQWSSEKAVLMPNFVIITERIKLGWAHTCALSPLVGDKTTFTRAHTCALSPLVGDKTGLMSVLFTAGHSYD